jgi:hypothetical protein
VVHQVADDTGAEPDERVLTEADLAGPAGQHHQGDRDHRVDRGDAEQVDRALAAGQRDQEQCDQAEQRTADPDRPHLGQVAQRLRDRAQTAAAK